MIMVEERWSSANSDKTRTDAKKNDAPCVMGLERNRSLRAAAARSNDRFSPLLSTWKDYAKQPRESNKNWSIGKTSSSITTTPDPTHLWWIHYKLREFGWKFWFIHFIVLILPPSDRHTIIICFISTDLS